MCRFVPTMLGRGDYSPVVQVPLGSSELLPKPDTILKGE